MKKGLVAGLASGALALLSGSYFAGWDMKESVLAESSSADLFFMGILSASIIMFFGLIFSEKGELPARKAQERLDSLGHQKTPTSALSLKNLLKIEDSRTIGGKNAEVEELKDFYHKMQTKYALEQAKMEKENLRRHQELISKLEESVAASERESAIAKTEFSEHSVDEEDFFEVIESSIPENRTEANIANLVEKSILKAGENGFYVGVRCEMELEGADFEIKGNISRIQNFLNESLAEILKASTQIKGEKTFFVGLKEEKRQLLVDLFLAGPEIAAIDFAPDASFGCKPISFDNDVPFERAKILKKHFQENRYSIPVEAKGSIAGFRAKLAFNKEYLIETHSPVAQL